MIRHGERIECAPLRRDRRSAVAELAVIDFAAVSGEEIMEPLIIVRLHPENPHQSRGSCRASSAARGGRAPRMSWRVMSRARNSGWMSSQNE